MSSCAASSCTCCPKASSASATLASSPTGGAPLSCRFACNSSAQYRHRRPNQKPPRSRNPAHFGSVPSVAAAWWSSRDLPRPSSNSVLHPFSSEPPHETTIPAPPLVRLTTSRRGAPFLPPNQAARPQPRLKLSPQPHANYHQTNPDCALVRSTPSCRSLSHIPNTIEFAINASPRAASFKQLYRTRPAGLSRVPRHTYCGARPIQHSRFWITSHLPTTHQNLDDQITPRGQKTWAAPNTGQSR